jgi:hypothetical protein
MYLSHVVPFLPLPVFSASTVSENRIVSAAIGVEASSRRRPWMPGRILLGPAPLVPLPRRTSRERPAAPHVPWPDRHRTSREQPPAPQVPRPRHRTCREGPPAPHVPWPHRRRSCRERPPAPQVPWPRHRTCRERAPAPQEPWPHRRGTCRERPPAVCQREGRPQEEPLQRAPRSVGRR